MRKWCVFGALVAVVFLFLSCQNFVSELALVLGLIVCKNSKYWNVFAILTYLPPESIKNTQKIVLKPIKCITFDFKFGAISRHFNFAVSAHKHQCGWANFGKAVPGTSHMFDRLLEEEAHKR